MPVLPALMGSNEDRMPSSPAAILNEINRRLPQLAADECVDLLALDRIILDDGLTFWHDPAIWHRSKHEVHPRAAALYGEHLARLLAAARGRSAKCLVLDLDNTLWGGVIGDDGLEGIVLGQGSELGEAHAELQRYALRLTERGIILAVCSKNDEANALAPFNSHPEMILKREHIACFVANWTDKATNLRASRSNSTSASMLSSSSTTTPPSAPSSARNSRSSTSPSSPTNPPPSSPLSPPPATSKPSASPTTTAPAPRNTKPTPSATA